MNNCGPYNSSSANGSYFCMTLCVAIATVATQIKENLVYSRGLLAIHFLRHCWCVSPAFTVESYSWLIKIVCNYKNSSLFSIILILFLFGPCFKCHCSACLLCCEIIQGGLCGLFILVRFEVLAAVFLHYFNVMLLIFIHFYLDQLMKYFYVVSLLP